MVNDPADDPVALHLPQLLYQHFLSDPHDRALKRAGLDYWEALDVAIHSSLDAMLATFAPERMWLASTRAPRSTSSRSTSLRSATRSSG